MTNSRESTNIIINMPPGKILLVVISRSLWECHMKAKPASDPGGFAIVPEGGVDPVGPVARTVAFGRDRGYRRTRRRSQTGLHRAGSPDHRLDVAKRRRLTGLLWSWHHS